MANYEWKTVNGVRYHRPKGTRQLWKDAQGNVVDLSTGTARVVQLAPKTNAIASTLNSAGEKWSHFWDTADKQVTMGALDEMGHTIRTTDGKIAETTVNPKTVMTATGAGIGAAGIAAGALTVGVPATAYAVAKGIGGAYLGGYLGGLGAEAVGANEMGQELGSDIGNFLGGMYGAQAMTGAHKAASTATRNAMGSFADGELFTLSPSRANIVNDVLMYPIRTARARLNGEYPLTWAERKLYILDRRAAIQKGIDYNLARQKTAANKAGLEIRDRLKLNNLLQEYQNTTDPSKKQELLHKMWDYEDKTIPEMITKYRDAGYKAARLLGLDDYNMAHYDGPAGVVFRRRVEGSNLPYLWISLKGNHNLAGVSAHEFNHSLMDRYPLPALSVYGKDLNYFVPNQLVTDGSPFDYNVRRNKIILNEFIKNNVPYEDRYSFKVWQNSPEEFQSELANLRELNFTPMQQVDYLSRRFNLHPTKVTSRIDWLDTHGYKKGGKLWQHQK